MIERPAANYSIKALCITNTTIVPGGDRTTCSHDFFSTRPFRVAGLQLVLDHHISGLLYQSSVQRGQHL